MHKPDLFNSQAAVTRTVGRTDSDDDEDYKL